MVALARVGIPALSTAFGLLMVGMATTWSAGPALAVGTAALTAVGVATVYRPAATLAVLLVVVAIVVSSPSPVLVVLSGLCATAYLVSRHTAGAPTGMVMGSATTVVAALCFTSAGLVAVSFPLQLPWSPLIAPPGALAIYVLATRPFTRTLDKG